MINDDIFDHIAAFFVALLMFAVGFGLFYFFYTVFIDKWNMPYNRDTAYTFSFIAGTIWGFIGLIGGYLDDKRAARKPIPKTTKRS